VKEYFLRYDETQSNDFTLMAGGRTVTLHSTDITDWTIRFLDTGLSSSIGDRLFRVREQVQDEEMFLANYADTLTDAPLDDMISAFERSSAVASIMAVPPVSTHHVVDVDPAGRVTGIRDVQELMQWENGGYFIMRPGIFDVLRLGEDLVPQAFNRLITSDQLMAQRYNGFWRAADTFKDRVELEEMFLAGRSPWTVWDPQRSETARARMIRPVPPADAVLTG
jgi:glucose-1-phosphate cytidylyltransferase